MPNARKATKPKTGIAQTRRRTTAAASGVQQPIVRIGDPEAAAALASIESKVRTDPSYAQSLLQRAGIVTRTGHLTKRFGG